MRATPPPPLRTLFCFFFFLNESQSNFLSNVRFRALSFVCQALRGTRLRMDSILMKYSCAHPLCVIDEKEDEIERIYPAGSMEESLYNYTEITSRENNTLLPTNQLN